MRDKKGIDSGGRGGGEDLREDGEGEAIISIYCINKIYFQWKLNKNKARIRNMDILNDESGVTWFSI